ncbi:MAG: cytochrome c oxidase subunit 3 family protein [Deltaproteobacteria bacterium]|nr:cytochrome c oxidase subunit 3 family protein [Deltaproteobacteria bacterium]
MGTSEPKAVSGANPGEHAAHASPAVTYEAAKLGIWTFIATEVLLFGGLFTTYIVFRTKFPHMFHADYVHLNRVLGAVNTVVLICSSLTVALGIAAIRKGKQGMLRLCLVLTILLAAGFLVIKYFEWTEKFAHGLYPGTDVFFSLYFMMTGLHGLHVLAGMLVLGAVLVLAGQGRFSESYHTPVEISGLYWHFVDLVWIYLFPLFYLIG